MIFQLQVPGMLVIKTSQRVTFMLPVWRMAAIWNCPQTPDGNIRRQSQVLLGQRIKTSWKM